MHTLFIQTNRKQRLGAKLGKYSFETEAGPTRNFEVRYIVAEELPELQKFVGTQFISSGADLRTYTFDDLQSFTLTRFKPPELMGYRGRAIVIDPDMFALPGTNISELFSLDLEGADLACVYRSEHKPETSLMVLDCAKLHTWKLQNFLSLLAQRTLTKQDLNSLRLGVTTKKLPSMWNSLDSISNAKILHTTRRLTQPWKTGLPIDFTPSPMPKLFGCIPREPIHRLLGKYPTHYQPHPDNEVIGFFFNLLKRAVADGAISREEIRDEIAAKNVRPDLLQMIS